LSEQRKYRSWTAQQKLEIVVAGMRGDRSVRGVCREHGIAETLYHGWRDKILEAGREALAVKEERSGERELRRKIDELERALVVRPTSWRSREKHCGRGSEQARRSRSGAGRRGGGSGGGGACAADQSAGDLPEAEAAAGAAAASAAPSAFR
jgi:transposase-like protein